MNLLLVFFELIFITMADSIFMNCGNNVPYCGILVLQRGGGSASYFHEIPQVHGLWPETGLYGTSQCVIPAGNIDDEIPNVDCYSDKSFQTHEYIKHGICASISATDFFDQVCGLSKAPLEIMNILKVKGYSLSEMASELQSQNYPIFNSHAGNDQLEISVCAGENKVWKISNVSDFESNCGNSINYLRKK